MNKIKNNYSTSFVVGNTVAFGVCNKSFKPLGIPSGRVNSRKGLTEMLPTNIM